MAGCMLDAFGGSMASALQVAACVRRALRKGSNIVSGRIMTGGAGEIHYGYEDECPVTALGPPHAMRDDAINVPSMSQGQRQSLTFRTKSLRDYYTGACFNPVCTAMDTKEQEAFMRNKQQEVAKKLSSLVRQTDFP